MTDERLEQIKQHIDMELEVNKKLTPRTLLDALLQEKKELYDEVIRLKQENERLQEEQEYNNYCDEQLRKKISNLEYKITALEDYKSRCEKAIEYIMVDYNDCKKLIDKDNITDLTDSYWQGVAITSRDLLNILQNGSEEK